MDAESRLWSAGARRRRGRPSARGSQQEKILEAAARSIHANWVVVPA